jgi:Uma2 family endonuclease
MTVSTGWQTEIEYPDSDGKPVAETDFQRVPLLYAVGVLDHYFQDRPDVYVSGNICFYYEEGKPSSYLSPDVLVIFGIPKRRRRSYKVWEEGGKFPNFILEVTSKSTVSEDQGSKKGLYAFWGVEEYFQFDPTGDYLNPPLQGLRLVNGSYVPLPITTLPNSGMSIFSQVLNLELRLECDEFRFYDPATGEHLSNFGEEIDARRAAERAQREAEQAQREAEQAQREAEQLAQQEAQRADRLAARLRELGIDPEH